MIMITQDQHKIIHNITAVDQTLFLNLDVNSQFPDEVKWYSSGNWEYVTHREII